MAVAVVRARAREGEGLPRREPCARARDQPPCVLPPLLPTGMTGVGGDQTHWHEEKQPQRKKRAMGRLFSGVPGE